MSYVKKKEYEALKLVVKAVYHLEHELASYGNSQTYEAKRKRNIAEGNLDYAFCKLEELVGNKYKDPVLCAESTQQ